MSKSKATPVVEVPAPPETFWFTRWLQELEAPLFDTGGSAVEGEERNAFALAQMATHPWTVVGAQLAMLNLALAQAGSAQAEWTKAWYRAWGIEPAGDGAAPRPAAASFDPFGFVAQAQAFAAHWAEQWTTLARAGSMPMP